MADILQPPSRQSLVLQKVGPPLARLSSPLVYSAWYGQFPTPVDVARANKVFGIMLRSLLGAICYPAKLVEVCPQLAPISPNPDLYHEDIALIIQMTIGGIEFVVIIIDLQRF